MSSVLDLFQTGPGPSSSHTVGPMRAALRFVREHLDRGRARVDELEAHLYGSLALTGRGHGTDHAVLWGLSGLTPEAFDPDEGARRVARITADRTICVGGGAPAAFDPEHALVFHRGESLPGHPNGMILRARVADRPVEATYYSTGGGTVSTPEELEERRAPVSATTIPYAFDSADHLLRLTAEHDLSIAALVLENERALRHETDLHARLLVLWEAMQQCVRRGLETEGVLPGGLQVRRRAPAIFRDLEAHASPQDPLTQLDWVNLWALAVNEENAAGGRIVTAPTNGAAGIVPAVLHYYRRFVPGADEEGIVRFLLAAGAIGGLFKRNASISGAEVGCQGEVGVACSMAAAGLTEARGGTPLQVEEAAEMAMEHNLGLTCDPVGGLVQIPCIERNAMGAVKAINAARLALRGDGLHHISLDRVMRVMMRTGSDMHTRYKETSQGGLAVAFPEC